MLWRGREVESSVRSGEVLVPEEEADGKIASEWRSGSGSRSAGVGEVRTEDEAPGVRCLGWSVGVLLRRGCRGVALVTMVLVIRVFRRQ